MKQFINHSSTKALRLLPVAFFLVLVTTGHAADATGPLSANSVDSAEIIFKDMVVKTYKTVIDDNLAEKTVFASDVKKLPLIDNDVFRAVQAHPGVSGDDFSARFSVRGGGRDETLVVLDGMELFFPFHLQDYGGALSVLDMLAVSKARLYLGGHPPQYGDKMSAVLEVETRSPSDQLAMDVGADLLNAHYFISTHPVFASVRAGYIGLLMELMQSEEKFSPHYGDVLVRLDHSLPDSQRLSSYLLVAGDLNTMDKLGVDDDVESRIQNAMLWARYQTALSPSVNLEAFPYGGIYLQERRLGASDRDDKNLAYAGAKSTLSWSFHTRGTLKTGLEYRWMRGNYDYFQSDSGISLSPDCIGHAVKGFISSTWKLARTLTNEIGLRMLYHPVEDLFEWAPYAALSWGPGTIFSFYAAWGLYYQPVTPLNLPVESGISGTRTSEQAVHWTGGIQIHPRRYRTNLRLEGYLKEYDNLSGIIRDYGRKSRIYWPRHKGRTWGIESIVDKGLGRFLMHLGYTYSVSEVTGGGMTFYSEDDRRHALDAGISWDPNKKWDLYLGFNLHSGTPYTEIHYNGSIREIGPPNRKRFPAYHSLSLRINRTWLRKSKKIQAYFQVLNLYNRTNIHEYTFTESEENGNPIFTRNAEGLFPILPALGINVSF